MAEAAHTPRRTFAIISHPDAGKTTLTEKLLLYAGALTRAGAVKARSQQTAVTSDWMALERQRGISVTSTAMSLHVDGVQLNLLDTPGHRDFSEDTYRVLSATDAVVMLLDAARGIEPQTLRLFEICRARNLPIFTFINKFDRPGQEPLALVDEIERTLDLSPAPLNWPVGDAGDFRGLLDAEGTYHRYTRTTGGSTAALEEIVGAEAAMELDGDRFTRAQDELELLREVGSTYDRELFLSGTQTPMLFGSAVSNFGVRLLLDALLAHAPAPQPWPIPAGGHRALDDDFSAFVFKVQANMDPRHRDTIAYLRVCSGRFERGMVATNSRTGRPLTLAYAHTFFARERLEVEEAWPGDVIGVVNAADLMIGDTLHTGDPVAFAGLPTFAPEHFATVRNADSGRYKQFRKGLDQLGREGVVQVLVDPLLGPQSPVLAGVGTLQFEVAAARMADEFGAPVRIEPLALTEARLAHAADVPVLQSNSSCRVFERMDGDAIAAFPSSFQLEYFQRKHPDVDLQRFRMD